MGGWSGWRAAALAAVVTAGCATTEPEGALVADPLEPLNRSVHQFNVGLDSVVVRPASQVYDFVTPELARFLLRNVVNHVRLVPIFANYVLQGDPALAGETALRFVTNTVMGGAGLLDPATDLGLPLRDTDLGITLAEWGVGEGPFVMLPLFGPQTTRDAVAGITETIFLNPFTYVPVGSGSGEIAFRVGRQAAPAIDQRAARTEFIDELFYDTEDSYTTLRAYYIQNRRQEVRGEEVDVEALPDIYGED